MTDGEPLNDRSLQREYFTNLHRAYNAMRAAFKIRVREGLTQDILATLLNVDKALISKRLNGSENLTLKTLSYMATAMRCRLNIGFVPYEQVAATVASAESEDNKVTLRTQDDPNPAHASSKLVQATTEPSPETSIKIEDSPNVATLNFANVRYPSSDPEQKAA